MDMKIYFATGNRHKVEEAQIAMQGSDIELEILAEEKEEPSGWNMEKVAKHNAKKFADKMRAPVIVEDTGVFFEALENFPGAEPKRWFEKLGYEGLLAKLEDQDNKRAYFQTIIGYCEPRQEPVTFSGKWRGEIAPEPRGMDEDVMPYERIFITDSGKFAYEYSREEKGKISHRAAAFRKLKDFLYSK